MQYLLIFLVAVIVYGMGYIHGCISTELRLDKRFRELDERLQKEDGRVEK